MITLFSYPPLFGIPDNNPFGLKVDSFIRFTQIPYTHKHIMDTSQAPRGQLPYLTDEQNLFTDSNKIIAHLDKKYKINLDNGLSLEQINIRFLIIRMLDNHLYWVMSYSRWQDEDNWPLFKAEFLRYSENVTEELLDNARMSNIEKYRWQGIGKYSKEYIYHSGIEDLQSINEYLSDKQFLFGNDVRIIDLCCYGFLANIYYFKIPTPLKEYIMSKPNIIDYIERIRAKLNY